MAWIHSKQTVITIGGDDISGYVNSSDLDRTADSHDVTTYGKNAHVKAGGLGDGSANVGGIYDNTANTGPRAVLEPLVGTVVELVRQPEGAGAGKPQDVVNVLVTSYKEDAPIADYVKWSLSMELSDEIDSTPQS